MPHLSPLFRFLTVLYAVFGFWPNFFAVLRFWMIFSFGFAVSNIPQCPPLYKVKYIFFVRRSKEILTVFATNASSLVSLILDTILNALFGNHGVGILLYKTVDYHTTYAEFLGEEWVLQFLCNVNYKIIVRHC